MSASKRISQKLVYDTPTIEEQRAFLNDSVVYEIYTISVDENNCSIMGKKIDQTYWPDQACLLIDNYNKQGKLVTMIIN